MALKQVASKTAALELSRQISAECVSSNPMTQLFIFDETSAVQACNNVDPTLSSSRGKSPTSSQVVVKRKSRSILPTAPPVEPSYHLLQGFIAGRFGGQMAIPYDRDGGGDPLFANQAKDHHTDASERRVSRLQIPHHCHCFSVSLIVLSC